jgi:D-amino-acid dehydrogenase
MNRPYDAIVVGAGVVGVATTYALARRGLSVCLMDCLAGPGRGASFANGAQLSYAYADALAAPALFAKLPKLALGLDPLFRLTPGADPGLYGWLASFLANMGASRFAWNTRAVLGLAPQSKSEMQALLARHAIAFDHAVPGKMHLLYSPQSVAAAARIVDFKKAHGAQQDMLSPAQATAIEPALADAAGLAGVVYSPSDAVGDPRLFCEALSQVCRRELGVETCYGHAAPSFERDAAGWSVLAQDREPLRSRRLILCAGPQSRAMGRGLGVRLPIQPMKGYSFTARMGPRAPIVSITDTKRKIVFCRLGDRMRVAGLAELGNRSPAVDPKRAALLRQLAREALPGAADYDAIDAEWAGLRPMTPNSQPIIRWVDPGFGINTGHGMLGWTLAMGSAARLAQSMPPLSRGS